MLSIFGEFVASIVITSDAKGETSAIFLFFSSLEQNVQ